MPVYKRDDRNQVLVICDCETVDHNFTVTVEHDDEFAYFDFRLNPYLNIWQRLVVAVKYVLGMIERKSEYNSVLVYRDDVVKLVEYLEGFVNANKS